MRNRQGIGQRLGRAFLLQAALISAAAFIGVYAAGFMIEEVLIKRALEQEADYFWKHYEQDPDFARPDTRNLTGYLSAANGSQTVPEQLREMALGFHKLPTQADFSIVYVTERAGRRLYLVFDGEQVRELALFFGLLPLAGVLIVLYLSAWLAYRLSRRAVSPLVWLADEVHKLDPGSTERPSFSPSSIPGDPDQEVLALSEALSRLSRRIDEFVERERNFTRDTSHELRSPLTVIKLAADMLLSEQELEHRARNSVLRIKRAATDMEELSEAFLLLARESESGLSVESVCVNEIVAEELERAEMLLGDKPVETESTADCRLIVNTSEKALSVLVGNLVRNAFSYTDAGRVAAHVGCSELVIEDSGVGIPEEKLGELFKPFVRGESARRGGHGVGLTIVKRLSDRFGWPVRIDSTPGIGTRVVVEFPDGECGDAEPSAALAPGRSAGAP